MSLIRTILGLTLPLMATLVTTAASAQEGDLRPSERGSEREDETASTGFDWSGVEEMAVYGTASSLMADLGTADSVVAFDSQDLLAIGAQSIADLASFTPNLEIVTSGATTPTFFIRGVGLNDFNPNSTGAVAIYQDDVAINAPALQLGALFDVEAVNVLRGPQGTGLGRNASAGAIKLYSKKPTGEYGGFLRTDFGNFGAQDYEGAVEAPIYGSILAARAAFRFSQRDGTLKNRCGGAPPLSARAVAPAATTQAPWSICGEPVAGGEISPIPIGLAKYVNDQNNWAARGTVSFEPVPEASWLFNVHGSRRDELTRLGQAIGTNGNFCIGGDICSAPFAGVPAELRGRPSGGLLGATQGSGSTSNTGYQAPEVRARLGALAPCLVAAGTSPDRCALQPVAVRAAANKALIQVANELADDLDSAPWTGDFNRTGKTTNDTWGTFLKSELDLPWEIKVKTTSAYDRYERQVDIDLDFSPETLFHILTEDDAWQFYQDVSITGDFEDDLPLSWELGGWFLREELDVEVDNDFGGSVVSQVGVTARDYSQNTSSAAAYAYVSFDFLTDFTLDGGVRYNWEQKNLQMGIESGQALSADDFRLDDAWQAPTGTVRLTYRFREDTHVFWKYTRGWKPGSFNATASRFSGPTVADAEEVDSFEAGIRGSWFDDRFGIDASLFFYTYSQYQIFTAQQFLGGTPEFVILNANDAEVYGAEVDANLAPWEGAVWNARFSWLETQFLDFLRRDQFLSSSSTGSPVNFVEQQNSGNPLLNSPRFKVSLSAEQSFAIGRYGSLSVRWDGVWSDTTFFDASAGSGLGNQAGEKFLPDTTIAQKAFWLHNLRLTWRNLDSTLEVAGWVRNLENEAYKTFAFDGSTFQATTIFFVGDPRTYGASLQFNF